MTKSQLPIPSIDRACIAASAFFEAEITPKYVRSRTTLTEPLEVRWWVMAWLRACTPLSYQQIATQMHRADHTTIIHGQRQAHEKFGVKLFNRLSMIDRVYRAREQRFHDKSENKGPLFVNGQGWKRVAA